MCLFICNSPKLFVHRILFIYMYIVYNNVTQICLLSRYINLELTAYSCSYCHFSFYCSRYKMQVFKMKLFTTQGEDRFISLGFFQLDYVLSLTIFIHFSQAFLK